MNSPMIPSGSPKKISVSTKPITIANMTPPPSLFSHFIPALVEQNRFGPYHLAVVRRRCSKVSLRARKWLSSTTAKLLSRPPPFREFPNDAPQVRLTNKAHRFGRWIPFNLAFALFRPTLVLARHAKSKNLNATARFVTRSQNFVIWI